MRRYFLLLSLFSHPKPPLTYSLSLHDALPISGEDTVIEYTPKHLDPIFIQQSSAVALSQAKAEIIRMGEYAAQGRSEEHTSELQSRGHLVCRLLLEKKKYYNPEHHHLCRSTRY